jgi:hypothetical protein
MIKNFVIVGLLWFGGRYIWNLDFTVLYDPIMAYLAENQWKIFIIATLGATGFVIAESLLMDWGFFLLMHISGKLLFELSQFVICFVSIFAVIFFYQLQLNLWQDLGILILVPFEALLASCFSLHIFDFNYPLGEKVVNNIGLPILSGTIVILSVLFR